MFLETDLNILKTSLLFEDIKKMSVRVTGKLVMGRHEGQLFLDLIRFGDVVHGIEKIAVTIKVELNSGVGTDDWCFLVCFLKLISTF